MDLSSATWESLGAGGASLMSKVQQMTESLAGKIDGSSSQNDQNGQNSAIPFANDPTQANEEIWLLGKKYLTNSGNQGFCIFCKRHESFCEINTMSRKNMIELHASCLFKIYFKTILKMKLLENE